MTSPYYNSSAEEEKFFERIRKGGLESKMNYKVKTKKGLTIFHDKDLAEDWAKKHKSVVEEITALDWKDDEKSR